ncbi:hypothetical protein [Luteimonas sp. e5]
MKSSNRRQTGQAVVEYTVVLAAVVIVLLARPDVITELVEAMKSVYEAFVYAISLSSIPFT